MIFCFFLFHFVQLYFFLLFIKLNVLIANSLIKYFFIKKSQCPQSTKSKSNLSANITPCLSFTFASPSTVTAKLSSAKSVTLNMRLTIKIAISWKSKTISTKLKLKSISSTNKPKNCLIPQRINPISHSSNPNKKFKNFFSTKSKSWRTQWSFSMKKLIKSGHNLRNLLKLWLSKWAMLNSREKIFPKNTAGKSFNPNSSTPW